MFFGRKIGLIIDGVAVLFWPLFIGLGVMGVWTLMAELRIYLIGALLAAALIKRAVSRKKVRGMTIIRKPLAELHKQLRTSAGTPRSRSMSTFARLRCSGKLSLLSLMNPVK